MVTSGHPCSQRDGVLDDGAHGNEFSDAVNWVEIDLGEEVEDADHYIDPEERLRVYMAIQWDTEDWRSFNGIRSRDRQSCT